MASTSTGLTSIYLIPYPVSTDPVNVHEDVQALAEKVDLTFIQKAGTLITNTFSLPQIFTTNINSNSTTFTLFSSPSILNIGTGANTISIGSTAGTLTINNPGVILNSTSYLKLPVGATGDRPASALTGMVRYNTSTLSFEGYSSGQWTSLGGVKSADGLTYIIAETSAGASNDELEFYAAINGSTTSKVGGWNQTRLTVLNTTDSTAHTDGALVVAGGVGIAKKLFVNGATTFNNASIAFNGATTSFTTTQTSGTFSIFNTTFAGTLNIGGLAAAINLGSTTATNTVSIASGATLSGSTKTLNLATSGVAGSTTNVNIGSSLGSGTTTVQSITTTLARTTTLNIDGVSPTLASTSTGTLTLFNTNLLTVNAFGTATIISLGTSTASLTHNYSTGATISGSTKTVNIGTNGQTGSTTVINIGSSNSGITTVNGDLIVTGSIIDNNQTIDAEITPIDDIYTFDNLQTRFMPTYQGVKLNIQNPLRLLITINGIIQRVDFPEYVWQSPLPRVGFQIDNDGYLVFSEPIPAGSDFDGRLMSGPVTTTKARRYPFKATDILIGG